jgi:hypothetical protein
MYYTSLGTLVKRFDVCTNTQLANFTNLGNDLVSKFARALRLRPNGEVLVANWANIVRLNSSGSIIQTYDVGGENQWFALTLDPDGTSFWSAGLSSGNIRKFDIASGGSPLLSFNAGPVSGVMGLTIKGEIAVGSAPLSLSPSSLSFGSQVVDTTSTAQAVTLTNISSTAFVGITSITTSGDFAVLTEDCPDVALEQSLGPGEFCTISVTFTPTTTGPLSGTVTIDSDDAPFAPHVIPLSGTGVTPAPAVSLSTSSLSFASQQVGTTSASQSLTLTNTGGGTLDLSATITTTGDFSQSNNCGSSLAAGASCSIDVTFAPTAAGLRTGTVRISSNAPGSPHTVSLTGTGVAPTLSFSPASLDFGDQRVGTTSAAQTVTVGNQNGAEVVFSSISVSGDFAQTNNCPARLAVDASCTLSVTFTPTAAGPRSGVVTVLSDATGSPHTVPLAGRGTTGPAVALAPTSVNFPGNPLNLDCPTKDVTLTNSGDEPLTITNITVTEEFSQINDCGGRLAAGASCLIGIKFQPQKVGLKTGTLTVITNAPTSPHTVALSGTGTPVCQLLAATRSTTLLRGTDATDFAIEDAKPSCSPGELNLTCSVDNPAACTLQPAVIPPSGSSTLKVSNLKAVRAESLRVLVTSRNEFRTASELLSVLFADFAFTRAPDSATIRAGETVDYSLAIRSVNGLAGNVSLACSGAPRGATCRVTPAAVTLDGSSLAQAKLQVTTTARATAGPGGHFHWPPRGQVRLLVLGLFAAALLALGAKKGRRVREPVRATWAVTAGLRTAPMVALVATLLVMLLWAACGGGGGSLSFNSGGTPAGTYTLTVSGTYTNTTGTGPSTLTNTTTVDLKVN